MAWLPFIMLSAFVVHLGAAVDDVSAGRGSVKAPVPGLHSMVIRTASGGACSTREALRHFRYFLAFDPGTGTFIAGLITGPLLGLSMKKTF